MTWYWRCAVIDKACKQPVKTSIQHKLAILSGLITLTFVSKSRLILSGWLWNHKGWTKIGKADAGNQHYKAQALSGAWEISNSWISFSMLFWTLRHLLLVLNKGRASSLPPSVWPQSCTHTGARMPLWVCLASLFSQGIDQTPNSTELHTTSSQDFGFGVIPLCTSPPPHQCPLLHPIKLFSASMREAPSSPFFLCNGKHSMGSINVTLKIDTPRWPPVDLSHSPLHHVNWCHTCGI